MLFVFVLSSRFVDCFDLLETLFEAIEALFEAIGTVARPAGVRVFD